MKNKTISFLLASITAVSMILNPHASNSKKVLADELNNAYSTTSVEKNKDYLYLSELEYDTSKSNTAYKSITKDTNTNGSKIKLVVDGEIVQFEKGMGAHATSTLIYDLSNYSSEYTRFVSYLGLDNSMKGSGNGAKFTISTSTDGVTWTDVHVTDVLTADKEAAYVNIDISNARYLKLYAHDNGNNARDHAVYGDARIVKKDYDISSEQLKSILKVSEYDNILKQKSVEENLTQNEDLILKRAFVSRIGYQTLQSFYKLSEDNKEALNWFLNDKEALKLYITGGKVEGSYLQSINVLSKLYKAYKEDLKDFTNGSLYKKMIISLAISHSQNIKLWTGGGPTSDAVTRYEIYKDLYLNNKLHNNEMFKNLPVELMRWVMDAQIDDEEIVWLNNHARKYPKGNSAYNLDPYQYIRYTFGYNYNKSIYYSEENKAKWNDKYNLENITYGATGHSKLWMVFEEGAVCGGISKTGTNLNEVFGIPAAVIGQPGHAAYLVYSQDNQGRGYWNIYNDVSGYTQSEKGERLPLGWGSTNWDSYYQVSYILLSQAALNDYDNYVKALELNLLADSYDNLEKKEEIYNKALEIQNFNMDSMVGLINTYKAQDNKTSSDYLQLAKKITDAYTYYPLPLVDILNLIKNNITEPSHIVQFDLLKTNALNKAAKATSAESIQSNHCRTMANSLLGKNSVPLASFSFDGENAKKIVINSKYDDSEIRVRYSLDGKNNWKETNDHIINLSEEEIASINENNDIVVGLVGTEDTYTIDIKKQASTNNNSLYKNDLENRLIGKTNNLEISLDDGKTWQDYTSEMRIEGYKVTKVRYKANGTYLQSDIGQYTFNEDTDTPTRKYVSIDNLTLAGYSSQQSTSTSHAAKNSIDGTANTSWHTLFNATNDKKFITVKLNDIKYITSVEYVPAGVNGRLKNAEIYTSFDGETWVKSGSVSNLANNGDTKTINLDKPTATKYIKVVATGTYGNYSEETNKYFSGKMLNFFEDSTKKYSPEPVITYSNTEATNQNVTATIEVADGCEIIGENTHTFTENKTHTFKYKGIDGSEKTAEATVTWIDKTAPAATVEYDVSEDNTSVVARLVSTDKELININTENGVKEFNSDTDFTFEYRDKVGNIGRTPVSIQWISQRTQSNTVSVLFNSTNASKISNPVTVFLVLNDNLEVVNNNGNKNYTFTKNGTFVFKIRNKTTNETSLIPVKVDWILE